MKKQTIEMELKFEEIKEHIAEEDFQRWISMNEDSLIEDFIAEHIKEFAKFCREEYGWRTRK